MLIDFKGKVAVITGGSSGIGYATAELLAENNCEVIITGKNKSKLDTAVKQLQAKQYNVRGFAFDVANPNEQQLFVQQLGVTHVDILITCAGMSIRALPQDITDEAWHNVMDTNINSIFNITKLLHPLLKTSSGYSKIITIGSMTSIFGSAFSSVYAVSKGAVIQLTKSLALAWAKDNILVNSILPGWVDTELTRSGRNAVPEFYNKIDNSIPLGRWATPSDIAKVLFFMSSDLCNYATGSCITVDGGFSSALI